MLVIGTETLLRTFPQTVDGGTVLVLEIGLRRMVAHLYQMQGDSWVLAQYTDDQQRLDTEVQLLLAGLDDPLLDRILLEMGVFWTLDREVSLESIIECGVPVLNRLLASQQTQNTEPHLVLVGALCLEEAFTRQIETVFPHSAISKAMHTHPTWTLPGIDEVRRDLETIKTSELREFYDLIVLRVNGKALSWERLNLFYPGMERVSVDRMVLPIASQTQSVYLWVARFDEESRFLDLDQFDLKQVVTAMEVYGLGDKRQLMFSARLTTDRRVHIDIPAGSGMLRAVSQRIETIYREERQQVRERSIPVETAIIVDQTLVPRVYERVRRLLIDLLHRHHEGTRWLMYFYNATICAALGDRRRFVEATEMEDRIQAHEYQDEYLREDYLPVKHALDRLTELAWHGHEANYFLLFTHHSPRDVTFIDWTKHLQQQYGIIGIVVWLKQLDLMEAAERQNYAALLHPYPYTANLDEGNLLFNDLEGDEKRAQLLELLVQRIVPTINKELNLNDLRWPLVEHPRL